MNRRSFLASAALLPISAGPWPNRELRRGLEIDRAIPVHIIVSTFAKPDSAERFRDSWIGEPFETMGEWYLQWSDTRTLPDELANMPGDLTYHTARVGEAGTETEYLVGAFRRDHIAFIVRIAADDEHLLQAIAGHFASQPLPGPIELAWSEAQLYRFIPTTDDLGRSVEEANYYWP